MKKEELVKYIEMGLNDSEIAESVGCHRTTIGKLKKQYSLNKEIVKNTNCKICKNEIKDNEKNRSRCNSCNTRIRRYRTKVAAVQYKGGCCNRCGWTGSIAAFEFHHINEDKEFNIGSAANKSWSIVKKEVEKCELLCANCHHIEHSSYADEIFLEEVKNYNGSLFK